MLFIKTDPLKDLHLEMSQIKGMVHVSTCINAWTIGVTI